MSMKIYGGVRFIEHDLIKVYEAVQLLRPKAFAIMEELERAWVARVCVNAIDTAFADGKGADWPTSFADSILYKTQQDLWGRRNKVSEPYATRDPVIDTKLTICAFPYEGRVYGMLFTEQTALRDLVHGAGLVEEWGYWNNTDKPDEVDEDEWGERSEVWHGILDRDPQSRPSACGLTFEFPIPYMVGHAGDVLARVPPIEARAKKIARLNVIRDRCKLLSDNDRIKTHAYHQAARFVLTEEAKPLIEAEVARLVTVLPEITTDLLLGR